MRVNKFKVQCLMAEHETGAVALAKRCGLQHKTLKRCLEGQNVSFVTVGKLAKGLETSPENIAITNENDSEHTWR